METGNKDEKWFLLIKEAIKSANTLRGGGQLDNSQAVLRFFFKKRPKWLVNYWWKCAHVLHEVETQAYLSISESNMNYLFWFAEGRMRLIPKPGVFWVTNNMFK